jgi:hypothetical protein
MRYVLVLLQAICGDSLRVAQKNTGFVVVIERTVTLGQNYRSCLGRALFYMSSHRVGLVSHDGGAGICSESCKCMCNEYMSTCASSMIDCITCVISGIDCGSHVHAWYSLLVRFRGSLVSSRFVLWLRGHEVGPVGYCHAKMPYGTLTSLWRSGKCSFSIWEA